MLIFLLFHKTVFFRRTYNQRYFKCFPFCVFFFNLYVHRCFACMCLCAPYNLWGQNEYWIAWNWSYRLFWAAVWVLGNVLRSSPRAASAQPRGHLTSPSFCFWDGETWQVAEDDLELLVLLDIPTQCWDYSQELPDQPRIRPRASCILNKHSTPAIFAF